MRLVSYGEAPGIRGGILIGDQVVDIESAWRNTGISGGPRISSVRDVLGRPREEQERLWAAAEELAAGGEATTSLDQARLGPPVPDPEKILCIGLNYRDHAEEAGLPIPTVPMVFAKFRNSLVGPTDPIVLLDGEHEIDYEGELGVVIGKEGRNVTAGDALEYVAGVMAFNDVSARDLQLATSQWTAGKAVDTFGPCGPALVTLDEIGDLEHLAVATRVNGRIVQDGSTADMIFSVAETIAHLTSFMTLTPGDIIATGTPAGVGFKRDPQILLGPGDVVEVEIEDVGTLRNQVVAPLDRQISPAPSVAV